MKKSSVAKCRPVYAFVRDWLNNVFIVVASALSRAPGSAVLKPAVRKIHVYKRGGCEICELEVARTFERIRKKMRKKMEK